MPDTELLTMVSLGFVLGLRHALDADHIAAVSTVLAQRPSLRASGLIGLSWGVGHTLILLLVGAAVLILGVTIPPAFSLAAEFGVAVMLVLLGLSLAIQLVRERWHLHAHDHDGERHLHFHSHRVRKDHDHAHWMRRSFRPLLIGMAHGLAGSAALVLLVMSTMRGAAGGLLYIAVFGLGSILGMMLLGLAMSLPVIWSFSFGRPAYLALQGLASAGSVALGLSMMVRLAGGEPPF